MNFLDMIIQKKKAHAAAMKKDAPRGGFGRPKENGGKRPFLAAFKGRYPDEVRIVAEIKRASPSRGAITGPDLDIAVVARVYEDAGAAAISVLTEGSHFGGSMGDLALARQATSLPVLRKDFIVDASEVFETAAAGADAVLIIAEALETEEIEDLAKLAAELELDVLLEVHSMRSFDRIAHIEGVLTGVNTRDLETLATDLAGARGVVAAIAKDRPVIVESGIHGPEDIAFFRDLGVSGFLIGTLLMSSPDPGLTLRRLKNTVREGGLS